MRRGEVIERLDLRQRSLLLGAEYEPVSFYSGLFGR